MKTVGFDSTFTRCIWIQFQRRERVFSLHAVNIAEKILSQDIVFICDLRPGKSTLAAKLWEGCGKHSGEKLPGISSKHDSDYLEKLPGNSD